jgi:DNA invertase Pin-like site-specific DNA recombinase
MDKPEGSSMTRVALYARYSSDQQREASIEDQLRLCRIYAEKQGWVVAGTYQDRAVSGASLIRPGVQGLLTDALGGRFDVVLAEALDRISRDQEDVAGVFKRMAFASVKIITLSEGEITHLHVGLKGTMNALFLKDLADKTRRGLRGRIEAGKAGGGLCYGYDVAKRSDAAGEPVRGERRINEADAKIVRRIFREFAAGKSPRAIALDLNREGVPGPFGHGDVVLRPSERRGEVQATLRGELLAILDMGSLGSMGRPAAPGVITNAVASPRNHPATTFAEYWDAVCAPRGSRLLQTGGRAWAQIVRKDVCQGIDTRRPTHPGVSVKLDPGTGLPTSITCPRP